jgi:NAD(P)-dependent dehydrogenase (short-subunit alcohol dehydrogenase family)
VVKSTACRPTITDAGDVARYAAAAAEIGGGQIHLFFNNAGIEGPIAPIVELADERFDEVIAVNVRGVYLGLKHVLPRMRAGAAIVNTGSTGSQFGTPNISAYVASKHAVLGLTRCVAKEVADLGIRRRPSPARGRGKGPRAFRR